MLAAKRDRTSGISLGRAGEDARGRVGTAGSFVRNAHTALGSCAFSGPNKDEAVGRAEEGRLNRPVSILASREALKEFQHHMNDVRYPNIQIEHTKQREPWSKRLLSRGSDRQTQWLSEEETRGRTSTPADSHHKNDLIIDNNSCKQ